jgi:hypothetical protein
MSADIPYSNATSGDAARGEITKLLRRMGCDKVGFMDEFNTHSLLLAFEHRGRAVQIRASAKGWATWFLRVKPYTTRMRCTRDEYQARALSQGMIAVSSIIRDWVKGSVTAVECGLMPVDAMFLAHMITKDGQTLIEHVQSGNLLPPPRSA